MKEFDYYIYIDYSENLIGYNIIEKSKIRELLPKISKLKHYKNLKHKRAYLNSMKKLFVREKIDSLLFKKKIKSCRDNMDIFIEVFEFIKRNNNCIIFISIDDYQYRKFRKMIDLIDGGKTQIVKESELRKGSKEYKMSLIIDTTLNIERRKR
ncbi:hypothetical protein KAI04_00370 [Candidatus Pacearchaeota archaeon]|nr:hypothetical protein [Candidatus Pacearchaeota archaeon]